MRQEYGFTLMEVLVSIFILSILTLAVIGVFNGGVFSIWLSGQMMDAIYQVQDALEAEQAAGNPFSLRIPFPEGVTLEVEGHLRSESAVVSERHEREVSAELFIPQKTEQGSGR